MALWIIETGEPQWACVGDTFVVGCQWSDNIVYRKESFIDNPDGENPKYNTKYGMYEPNVGLEKLTLSWGHDEYMYQVLKHNKTSLPQHALNIIRFHSFYPWHSSGDYEYLMKPEDEETKKWVLTFKWVMFSSFIWVYIILTNALVITPQSLRFVHEINESTRYWRTLAVLSRLDWQVHSGCIGMVIRSSYCIAYWCKYIWYFSMLLWRKGRQLNNGNGCIIGHYLLVNKETFLIDIFTN